MMIRCSRRHVWMTGTVLLFCLMARGSVVTAFVFQDGPKTAVTTTTKTTTTIATAARTRTRRSRLFAASAPSNSNKSVNRYSSVGGGPPSPPSNQHPNEYDAIVLYPKSEVPFFLQETDDGEVAFAGYVQWDEPCSTIRSIGDVIVAIDGASTAGSSIKEVIQFIQEKARKHSHSFFRFRVAGTSPYDPNAQDNDQDNHDMNSDDKGQGGVGRLPGEKQRYQLEQDIAQIDRDVAYKRSEVDDLNAKRMEIKNELAEIHRLDLEWIEQKRGLLSQVAENPSTIFSDLEDIATPSLSAAAANTKSTPITTIYELNYPACIARVQQAMNLIYSNPPAGTDLKYDTLDHVKAVLTKLEKDLAKNKNKPEIEFLQSSVGIKAENFHVYVQEIIKIQKLLRSKDSKNNKNIDCPLTTLNDCLQRVFGPVSGVNAVDTKKK